MTDERASHWDRVFTTKAADKVSWFQKEPALSLRLLDSAGLNPSCHLTIVSVTEYARRHSTTECETRRPTEIACPAQPRCRSRRRACLA
jgi:hypothetical protein